MKIVNVYSTNIDTVIDGLNQAATSNDRITVYLKKSNQFYSITEISIELNNVKGFELLKLSDFCSKIYFLEEASRVNMGNRCLTSDCINGTSEYYTEVQKTTSELSRKMMLSYKSFAKLSEDNSDIEKMLPIGVLSFHVIARFEGTDIYSILGAIPSNKLIKDKTTAKTIFYDTTTKEFMNMIAKNFVTNFYSFIEEQTSLVDVLSDIMIKNHYFDSMDDSDKNVVLAHVNTPVNKIQLIDTDVDNIPKEVDTAKNFFAMTGIQWKDESNVFFVIKSSIRAYMIFKLFTHFVNYDCNLNINMVYPSDVIIPDEISDESYKAAYASIVHSIDDFRISAAKVFHQEDKAHNEESARARSDSAFAVYLRDHGSRFNNTYKINELYEYLLLGDTVTYTLKFKPSDFYRTFTNSDGTLGNELIRNTFGNSKEFSSIVSNIAKYLRVLNNSLN